MLSKFSFKPSHAKLLFFQGVKGTAQARHPAVEQRALTVQLGAPFLDEKLPARIDGVSGPLGAQDTSTQRCHA